MRFALPQSFITDGFRPPQGTKDSAEAAVDKCLHPLRGGHCGLPCLCSSVKKNSLDICIANPDLDFMERTSDFQIFFS